MIEEALKGRNVLAEMTEEGLAVGTLAEEILIEEAKETPSEEVLTEEILDGMLR